MPRLNEVRNYDMYGNPLDTNTNGRSVLDPNHPANSRDGHSRDAGRDYVFNQRKVNPLKLTLGWELEANHVPQIVPNGVNHISDGSVNGDGAEFVVLPAVTRSPRYVLGLLKGLVHSPRLNTDESCGFHVHVSASNLILPKMRQWALATEHLALQVEDLAFKAVPDSRKDNQYCRRIRPIQNGARFVSSKYSNERRYHWLNTVEMFRPNGIRTIENRLLGHTHRWKYVLAWALFTMELAQRGWDVANHPFVIGNHVDELQNLLQRIITEIKPLDKRGLPVPQWVYDGLTKHGIASTTFDRPLAKLTEAEYQLKGMSLPYYSDNQPELENEEEEDNEDSCPCGCGEEGRCESQSHSDGDCDSNYCSYCHEDGNCSGSPRCERCLENAHDNGDNCGRNPCSTCRPTPRRTTNLEVSRAGTSTGRVSINGSNVTYTVPSNPANFEALSAEVNAVRNQVIDNAALQLSNYVAHDALMYGTGIAPIVWADESRERPNENEVVVRERIARDMMTELEYDSSLERL